jgi:hypothetical protein
LTRSQALVFLAHNLSPRTGSLDEETVPKGNGSDAMETVRVTDEMPARDSAGLPGPVDSGHSSGPPPGWNWEGVSEPLHVYSLVLAESTEEYPREEQQLDFVTPSDGRQDHLRRPSTAFNPRRLILVIVADVPSHFAIETGLECSPALLIVPSCSVFARCLFPLLPAAAASRFGRSRSVQSLSAPSCSGGSGRCLFLQCRPAPRSFLFGLPRPTVRGCFVSVRSLVHRFQPARKQGPVRSSQQTPIP